MYENPIRSLPGAAPTVSPPNPSSIRISLPAPDVKTGVRGVVGMCTVMIVLLSTYLLAA